MSSTETQERIAGLLAKADGAIKNDERVKAAEALREASHLDSSNEDVKERWAKLQKADYGINILESLQLYLGSNDAKDGEKALATLKSRQLPAKDATEAIELLLSATTKPDLLDSLTGTLISRHVEARKVVAVRFSDNATEAFEKLFARGEESFKALAILPLEDPLWKSKDTQVTAQRDFFRLSVAKLIAAGAEHLERVMQPIARLLSTAPDAMSDIVDEDVMDAILSSLDIRVETPLRSQAMLATSKLLEATKERGEQLFSDFIMSRASKQTNDDLIIAFSAAAAAFPVIPVVASRLFLTDGFVQQLVPNLERNWEDGAAGRRKSHTLEISALELLSAACVDKACREAINRYCSHWLQNLTEEREGEHRALAALILAKISDTPPEDITAKLEQLVLSSGSEVNQAIEGIAYTSLQPKIKEEVAGNEQLLRKVIRTLQDRASAAFGCLTVLSNITSYRPTLSEEQKKISELKAYANSSKPGADDPLDDDAHVTARCRKVLDADAVPAIVSYCKNVTSLTNVALVVNILLSLAREQKHRAKMAQQGAVKLLLQIKDRIAKTDKSTKEASLIERNAAHGLARLLISVNPAHVFSGTLSASSAVSALAPLLKLDMDSEQRNLLPTFEGLLALTNLASIEEDSVRELELRLIWEDLEDHLLLSSNTLVQRASVELVCNLMASPNCVTKFVGDGSKREATRMQILLALADAEDLATRRAAGGALAVLTEWDAAVSAILNQQSDTGPRGIKTLLAMCADENDELKHRGLVCVNNLVNAPGDLSKLSVDKTKREGGLQILQESLKGTKNRDVMQIGVEVIKKLM